MYCSKLHLLLTRHHYEVVQFQGEAQGLSRHKEAGNLSER